MINATKEEAAPLEGESSVSDESKVEEGSASAFAKKIQQRRKNNQG